MKVAKETPAEIDVSPDPRGYRFVPKGVGPDEIQVKDINLANFRQFAYGGAANLHIPSHAGVAEIERIQRARHDILAYTQFTFPAYIADPFHEHMARSINKVVGIRADGTPDPKPITNLMLFAPPQHGKSEMVSVRLASFWLAHHHDLPVLLTSYAASRAHANSAKARSVTQTHLYQQLFGHLLPDKGNWRREDWHFKDIAAYVFAAGVGGPITGHGFGLGVIDDPYESWEAAQSEATRENVWEWWKGTFLTRMWEHSRIVLMMTRWNQDDLAGRILSEEGRVEEGGKWTVLSYSALSEAEEPKKDILRRKHDTALAPRRFSTAFLRDVRKRVGDLVWSAEYQQHPSPPQGSFYRIGRIQTFPALPAEIGRLLDGKPVGLLQGIRFWDLAATEKKSQKRDPDATCGSLMAPDKEGHWWVVDQVHGRWEPGQVEEMIRMTAKLDGPLVQIRIEIEPGASGISLVRHYITLLAGFAVEGEPHSGDKMAWGAPFASQVNVGNVFFLKADWNKPCLAEMADFPNGKHDDRPDSMAGAFNCLTDAKGQFKDVKFIHA
jgi:predicted phage terminase large subunit-like protein